MVRPMQSGLMHDQPSGQAWSLSGSTGTMAAALAANSIVFAMQSIANDPAKPDYVRRAPIKIEAMRMTFTAIVASATPVSATRALRLFKGLDNAQTLPATGTSLDAITKRTLDSGVDSGLTGAVIATTAALSVTGFTRGSVPLATFDLTAGGAVGGRIEYVFFERFNGSALYLDPGEILCVSNPAAFDALLTWKLTVDVDFRRRDSL